MLERALNSLNIEWSRPREEVFAAVIEFLRERLRYYLETARKLRYDTVRAVLAAGWDPPLEALLRAQALETIRDSEDFEALAIAAKRIKNILSKSAKSSDWTPGEVDTAMLTEAAEQELHRAYESVKARTSERAVSGGGTGRRPEPTSGESSGEAYYARILGTIADLRPAVDRFFDRVLVMAEDASTRQNRLRLLGKLDELFSGIAHVAEISASPSHVDAPTSGQ